jgi:hypothetical protein
VRSTSTGWVDWLVVAYVPVTRRSSSRLFQSVMWAVSGGGGGGWSGGVGKMSGRWWIIDLGSEKIN